MATTVIIEGHEDDTVVQIQHEPGASEDQIRRAAYRALYGDAVDADGNPEPEDDDTIALYTKIGVGQPHITADIHGNPI